MNKNGLLMCAVVVACLPFVAQADNVILDKDFNGLPIDALLVGDSDGGGQSAGGGVQALKVTNSGTVSVKCTFSPGPAESSDGDSAPAAIKPGKSATMRVPGKYTGTPLKAKLSCVKDE